MIKIKKYSLRLFFLTLLISISSIANAENFNIDKNYIVIKKHLNRKFPAGQAYQMLVELDELKQRVSVAIAQEPENPVYWFFKGAYSFAYIYAYSRQLRETNEGLSKEDKLERGKIFQQKRIELRSDTKESYVKALRLDQENSQLTPGMLDFIARYGGHELAIKALRRIYARTEYDPNDFTQYDARGAIVSRFVALGRFDEAEQEMQQIKKEYPKYINSINMKLKIMEKKREKYEAEQKAGTSKEEKPQGKKVVKGDFVTRQQLEELLKDTTAQKSEPSTTTKKDNGSIRNAIIAVIALLVVIILGGLAYRKMKR